MKKVKKKEEEILLVNSYKNVVFSPKVKKIIEEDYSYKIERWTQTVFGKKKKMRHWKPWSTKAWTPASVTNSLCQRWPRCGNKITWRKNE